MELLLPALTAFIITFASVFPTIKLAKKYKLVDDPKKRPHPAHLHDKVIPRAGGLAIFAGILISTLFFVPLDKHIWGIILGSLTLVIVGLWDDRLRNFSPFPRLILQILAAGIVVISGVGITFITNPLGGIIRLDTIVWPINFLGLHNILVIADLFAFFWIVWMMNMINWANGVDGQTPGIIVVAAVVIGLFSFRLYTQGDPNQLNIAILAFITAGAALGILPFNWHPAKIFLGNSGTTLFGFMIAVLSILSGAKLAIALLVLLVPATDSIYTGFRRILSGKSPFFGDRKHLHHLLLRRGWSHQKISLFYISTCVILGLASLNLPSQGKLFTVVGVGVVILGGILWLNFFGDLSKRSDPDNG